MVSCCILPKVTDCDIIFLRPFRLRYSCISGLRLSSRLEKQPQHRASGSIILLMAAGHNEKLERLLLTKGYTVVVPPTSDQAVAFCLHNRIAAVLIDEGMLTEVEDWSLARSFKGVSPNTPVLLLVRDPDAQKDLPPGVDFIVSKSEPAQVLNALRDCAA